MKSTNGDQQAETCGSNAPHCSQAERTSWLILVALWIKRIWWVCIGGRFHDERFRVLSRDIQGNRKLISELRASVRTLENQMWLMEGHTHEETMERLQKQMSDFRKQVQDVTARCC